MRLTALLVAIFGIAVAVVGLVSPETGTTVRRLYFATPAGLYSAAALRIAMGLVVILASRASRSPRILLLLGLVVCMQGVSATVLGPERARAVLEFEAVQGAAILRLGAIVALASWAFVAFAVTSRRPKVP